MRFRQRDPRRFPARLAALPFVALTVLTTFACSLDKLLPPEGTPAQVTLAVAGDTTVAMGGTTKMTVATTTGTLDAAAANLVWTSDAPTIATVDPASGIVTGVAVGTANISAKAVAPELGEINATARKIRVTYAGIRITAIDSLIALNMTKVITVRGTNQAGVLQPAIPFSSAMTVTSRDPSIFTVNTAGALVAVANGTARLFVQVDGLKDSVNVKVRQVARSVTYPAAVASELPIQSLNKDRALAVIAKDSLGNVIASPTVTWATSDATTISVGATTGIARGLKLGTATITSTVDGLSTPILGRVTQVPAILNKIAGDGLSAVVGLATSAAPRVAVLDSGNTPVPGVQVDFTVVTGGGSVAGGSQTSATNGEAAATSWTLGTVAGPNTLTAAAGNASTTFNATGTAGSATKLIFSTQPSNSPSGFAIQTFRVAVADANGNVVTSATNSITVSVASGPGTIGGTQTVTAVAGVASFSTITLSSLGVYTLSAVATGLTAGTSNSFAVFGPATKLAFTTQPVGGTASQTLTTFRVSIQDASGNTATTATNTITLTIAPSAGVTLGGTVSAPAVAGVATFTNITVSAAGTYTLTAAATGLTSATSTSFTIAAVGPPAKLGFVVQPQASVVAGSAFSPDIKVAIQDAGGVTNTSSTASVTLAFETNVNGATITGTTTVAAIAGVATFTGISINKSGVGYKLNATSGTLTKAVSSAFTVTAGAAFKLGFANAGVIPNSVVNLPINPGVQVQVQDANNNLVTTANNAITISLPTAPTALSGTVTATASAGVATFNNLVISAAGTYQLSAQSTGSGLQNGASQSFSVVPPNAAIKVAFTTQPSSVSSGVAISPPIQVAVQDNSGNTVSSAVSVTLALGNAPAGATIGGTLTRTSTAGIATFDNITLPLAGTGYTLTASSASLTSATSTAFNVVPGAATKLAFLVQPVTTTAGVPFATDLQVQVTDANGNLVPTATNTITIAYSNSAGSSSSTLKGTLTATAVNGIATFPGVRITRAASGYTLFASSTGLSNAGSSSFDIVPAPAVAVGFRTQPQFVTAGATMTSAIQAAIVDSLGNPITTIAPTAITIALSTSPAGATMSGTATQNTVSGVATFADLTFPKAGSYVLSATTTDYAAATSSGFSVGAAAASKLGFFIQPTNTFVNARMNPGTNQVQVQVQDPFGNVVTSNAPITIALGTNPTAATIGGTLTVNASFGTMTVPTDVTISKAGTGFTLTASTSGLTSATSNAFNVAAFDVASGLAWVQQPADNVTDAVFRNPIKVAVVDLYQNIVTSNNGVTLTIGCQQGCSQANGTATTVSGVATFTNYTMSTAGTFNLFQSGPSLFGPNSSSFLVGAAVAATANVSVYDIAINSGNAFFIERNGLSSALKQVSLSTGTVTSLQSGLNNPAAVVSDGVNVYWIEDGSGLVKRAPVGVANAAVTTMSTVQTNMGQLLQTDGTNLFFIANNAGNTQREIKKLAMNAAAGTTPTTFYTATCGIASTCLPVFTISGTTIYYYRSGESNISSVSTAGGTSTALVNSVAQPGSIAVGANLIYFTSGSTLITAPIAGGASTTRGTPFSASTLLAFDGSGLYALDQTNTTVRKFNVTDFTSIALTTTTAGTGSRGLAFDANFVFYADNAAPPKLRRVAK